MLIKRTFLLIVIFLLAACGPQQPTGAADGSGSTPDLTGHEWSLTEMNGSPPIGSRTPTLKLEDRTIGGTTGCNSYGGAYQLQDGQLTFTEIFQTEMACIDPAGIMEQEANFLQALNQTAGFQVSGERLELKNAAGETTLVFER